MEMNMKSAMKLLGILVASTVLVACGGGSGKPVKMVKVWKNVKEVKTTTVNGKTPSIITNTYDKNGLLARKEIDEDANGQFDGGDTYTIYSNGSDGTLLKKISYDVSGNKFFEVVMDRQGGVTERISYDKSGGVEAKETYVNTYDDKGKVIRIDKGGDARGIIIFTYSDNLETQKYYYKGLGGGAKHTLVYTRNDRGELMKHETYNKNQELVAIENYTYEYDGNDNVITKTFTDSAGSRVTTYTWEERSVPEIYAK